MKSIINYLKTNLVLQLNSCNQKTTKSPNLFLIIFFSILFFGQAENSEAQTRPTTLYVDVSYTGTTSNGTEEFPYKKIHEAVNQRRDNAVWANLPMVSDEEIIVKSGTYTPTGVGEQIFIDLDKSGEGNYWFTLKAEGNVVIDGSGLFGVKFAAMIGVSQNARNVRIEGFKLKSLRDNPALTTDLLDENGNPVLDENGNVIKSKDVKFGIQLAQTLTNIEVINNEIYDFSWNVNVDPMKNRAEFTSAEIDTLKTAQGLDNIGAISIVGNQLAEMSNIKVINNYIHHIIPGYTEGIQVNGNINGFLVENNIVEEVQNIGIVAAGHYGWVVTMQGATVTPALNQSRNGIIRNNTVRSCRSPIAIAGGIYCDGPQNIIVENNICSDGQVGFSIGNENENVSSGGHIVRNNIAFGNSSSGIMVGVAGHGSGSTMDNVLVTGNTFYGNGVGNDTYLLIVPQAECIINNNIENLSIKSNIFYTVHQDNKLVTFSPLVTGNTNSFANSISFDYNLYYTNSTASPPAGYFDWSQLGTDYDNYGTFNWYRQSITNQDVHSSFANPNFKDITSSPIDLSLQANSLAINAGDPNYVVATGETDFYGNDRIDHSIIDIGAYESGAAAAGDQAAAIDGVKSIGEGYIALQTGVTQGVWKNIYAYDDNHFIYVYAEYDGALSEYSIFVNTDSSTGYQETWTDKTNYYVDGTLNLLNRYNASSNNQQWPFTVDNDVMNIRFVKTTTTIEGRIPKDALGFGDSGTIGLGLIGYSANWASTIGSIPLETNSMVYLTLNGGSEAGSLSVDGYKSPVEDYEALITGVTGSSFSSIYGYTDSEYIYLYAEIDATNLDEYEVYFNTDSATGFQYLWTDKSNYFIDANYNVLNTYDGGASGWPFIESSNCTGIEFIMTPQTIEGKILKSLLGLGNSGTIGIGLEGHTQNWNSSLGGVPVSGNMVYLSLGETSSSRSLSTIEEALKEDKLKVYPNPAAKELKINYTTSEAKKVLIELIGIDGRSYFSKEIYSKSGTYEQTISVGNLRRGMFILKVITGDKVETKKVILK